MVQTIDIKKTPLCDYCGVPQLPDDLRLAQWVPLSEILRYEVAMAVQEMLRKQLKNRTALEVVQGKLRPGTVVHKVYGPRKDASGVVVQSECSEMKMVVGPSRAGIELKKLSDLHDDGQEKQTTGRHVLHSLMWPDPRCINLTVSGFEITNLEGKKLVAYEWCEEEAQAAQ